MYRTFVETRFSAAHQIKGYKGHCGKLHGHTWKVRVEVITDQVNDIGISIDFKELKSLIETILENIDHHHINEIPPFKKENPTAENLSKFLYHEMKTSLPSPLNISGVTVWESENHGVTYSE